MKLADPYKLFHLTDATMGIDKTLPPKRQSKQRGKFVDDIKFSFPVGVFKFKRHGSPGKWVVVCRLQPGDSKSTDAFHNFILEATRQAPVLLSPTLST